MVVMVAVLAVVVLVISRRSRKVEKYLFIFIKFTLHFPESKIVL